MYDVTGIDLVQFVKKVYDKSKLMGLGYLHYNPTPLTDEQAQSIIRVNDRYPVDMNYVLGRCCKMMVKKEDDGTLVVSSKWYDHEDGELESIFAEMNFEPKVI